MFFLFFTFFTCYTIYLENYMKNILDITVSGFSNYLDKQPKDVNLFKFLTSDKYSNTVNQIRNISDKKERDKLKATLPAITPSGLFAISRKDENLKKHSGFICIDIDKKGNEAVSNYNSLKTELCKIPFVAYCGLSVSGNGYFVLIPIKEPQHHKEYFNSLLVAFQDMNITIDKSCSNVSRLRGYSYDNEAYFNNNSLVWDYLLQTKETPLQAPKTSQKTDNNYFDKCLNIIQTNRIDMTNNYNDWFTLLGCLANTFGESGRQYAHIISQYHPKYKATETDYYYNNALKSGNKKTDISTFFYYCKQYNISYKDEVIKQYKQPEIKKSVASEESEAKIKLFLPEPQPETIQKLRLKELIIQQWKKFDIKYFDLSKPYDLMVSVEHINANYKMNISEKEYLEIYQSIN